MTQAQQLQQIGYLTRQVPEKNFEVLYLFHSHAKKKKKKQPIQVPLKTELHHTRTFQTQQLLTTPPCSFLPSLPQSTERISAEYRNMLWLTFVSKFFAKYYEKV